jgi:DNA-binding NtrC family response regulator
MQPQGCVVGARQQHRQSFHILGTQRFDRDPVHGLGDSLPPQGSIHADGIHVSIRFGGQPGTVGTRFILPDLAGLGIHGLPFLLDHFRIQGRGIGNVLEDRIVEHRESRPIHFRERHSLETLGHKAFRKLCGWPLHAEDLQQGDKPRLPQGGQFPIFAWEVTDAELPRTELPRGPDEVFHKEIGHRLRSREYRNSVENAFLRNAQTDPAGNAKGLAILHCHHDLGSVPAGEIRQVLVQGFQIRSLWMQRDQIPKEFLVVGDQGKHAHVSRVPGGDQNREAWYLDAMRLLLVEDKDTFRRLLVQALAGSAWDVLAVGDPMEALEALERSPFEVLVTDLRLPGITGLELLKRAKRLHPGLRIVLMSAFGEPKDIVEAMRSGADEFLPKPFDLDHFIGVLDRLLALVEAPPPDPRELWITQSPAMRQLDQSLSRAADSPVPVLFHGERGVGKLRAARRLHTLRNPQSPFLSASAASLPDERHLKLLAGGSLYLTDLEGLPAAQAQVVLHLIASNEGRNIHWMGGARALSEMPEALRLSLGVLTFEIPPLRDRKEDVLPLFRGFLETAARQEGRSTPLVERTIERDLLQRAWPGNLREMAWCVTQSLRATRGLILTALPDPSLSEKVYIPLPEPGTLESMLAELAGTAESALLRRALEANAHNPAATAAALGLTPRVLAQRLREHRIPLEET